jgi:hypothetical protein
VLALALALCLSLVAGLAQAASLSFEVSFTPQVRSVPFTGRILVFTGPVSGSEPRFGPDWFSPEPFYALDVRQLPPGETVRIGQCALGFPAPLGEWPSRQTRFQAVLDQALDDWQIGTAPGNGMSLAVRAEPNAAPVRLVIDRLIPEPRFPESARVKLVEIPSPRLTEFSQRPRRLRAGVILPEGYLEEPAKRFPVLYLIPGFGGNHFQAFDVLGGWSSLTSKSGPNALVVVLDPTAHTGHHVFADSPNNGPVGAALVEEMVPHIDRTFRTVAEPRARLLTGHSSGGWSSLWLQCAYPDLFGGVWSTSPDPVDFRDFQRLDLYEPGANLFIDGQGNPRPIARRGETPIQFIQPFSDMELVLGHGGQLQSFEAVFSPRGDVGGPKPLYDRRSGAIDRAVALEWGRYDIRQKLTRNWGVLGPKLAGKLHVYTGALDTFYLEGAVRLLKGSLAALGSDAVIEIVPGKDHGTLLGSSMRARIAAEMVETLQHAGIGSGGVP